MQLQFSFFWVMQLHFFFAGINSAYILCGRVYVHDLDLFVTVQILDDTAAVLSLGELCEEHGYTYEWATTPDRTREEGFFFAKWKVSYLLLSLDGRPILVLHRRTRQVQLQVQHQSEVTTGHQETGEIHQNLKKKEVTTRTHFSWVRFGKSYESGF